MAHCVHNFALFTFLARLMSLEKGLLLLEKTEMFTFLALLTPLKEGASRVGNCTRSADFMVTPSSGETDTSKSLSLFCPILMKLGENNHLMS